MTRFKTNLFLILTFVGTMLSSVAPSHAAPSTRPTTEPAFARVLRRQVADAFRLAPDGMTFNCGVIRHVGDWRFNLEDVSIARLDGNNPVKTVELLSCPEVTIDVGGWPATETPLRLTSVALNKPVLYAAPVLALVNPRHATRPGAFPLPDLDKLPWGLGKVEFPTNTLPPALADLKLVTATDLTIDGKTPGGPASFAGRMTFRCDIANDGGMTRMTPNVQMEFEIVQIDLSKLEALVPADNAGRAAAGAGGLIDPDYQGAKLSVIHIPPPTTRP